MAVETELLAVLEGTMQIHRLFEIVYILMERGAATASELASRFEVSTRTIFRDVETLSEAGIPVYASKGRGGGIRLLDDFVLDKSLLSRSEQDEILFALQSLKAANASDEDNVLSRMSALFRRGSVDWIDMDFSEWGSLPQQRDMFSVLKTGILEKRIVSFDYFNAKGESSLRTVEPVKLQFKKGSWYMQGFCRSRRDMRIFKISRMEHMRLSGEHFTEKRTAVPLNDVEYDGVRNIQIELLFSADMAWLVYDNYRGCPMVKNDDGSFTVTVEIPEDQWVYSWLLSLGEGVRVLSPHSVQEILREKASKIVSFYS